jgi:quercetin dioxygenase-like cupin family protein
MVNIRLLSGAALLAMCMATSASADEKPVKPNLLLDEVVEQMPQSGKQEIRVMTATFKPGDKTVFHTHRFPVTVYILDGTFTLELDGQAPVTVKEGEAFVEPPNVKMTGYNRSNSDQLEVVIFYVSDPETPFLDLIK